MDERLQDLLERIKITGDRYTLSMSERHELVDLVYDLHTQWAEGCGKLAGLRVTAAHGGLKEPSEEDISSSIMAALNDNDSPDLSLFHDKFVFCIVKGLLPYLKIPKPEAPDDLTADEFKATLDSGCTIVLCSCECGGRYAWMRPRPSGAYEMYGCICHNNPPVMP